MQTGEIIGLSGIIIGGIISFYFYWKGRRIKDPCWDIRSVNLIEGFKIKLENLEILYKHKIIDKLTISRIILWNAGLETINSNDITSLDPLRIIASENVNILDIKLLITNNPPSAINCILSKDGKSAFINFDYLDNNQGAVFQLIHTGKSSSELKMIGTIKGTRKITPKKINSDWLSLPTPKSFDRKISSLARRWINTIVNILAVIILSLLTIFSIIIIIAKNTLNPLSVINSIAYGLITLVFVRRTINVWRTSSPKGLEIFVDELI
jgi:hypothetical protein